MRLGTFAMYGSGITERVPLKETAEVYLGTKQRRRFCITDGAHEMPIVGEIVIKASDSVVSRTRDAAGRAETDCVQAVTHAGVVPPRQVTPKSADNRTEPQTTRVTGRSVPCATGGRRGQSIITHYSRCVPEARGACT